MIDEKNLAKLSYRGAPKIVTKGFHGTKTQEYTAILAGGVKKNGLSNGKNY